MIEKRLANVDFGRLTKTNRPGWREFCREHDPDITITEIDTCECYGFDQRCWAESEERWILRLYTAMKKHALAIWVARKTKDSGLYDLIISC